jgi:hypothetical protein
MKAMRLAMIILFFVFITNSTSIDEKINDNVNDDDTQFYEKLHENMNLLQNILKFLDTSERIKFLNSNPCGFNKNDSRLLCLQQFRDNKFDNMKQYSLKKLTNVSDWILFFIVDSQIDLEKLSSEIVILFQKLENISERKIELVLDSLPYHDIQFFLTLDNTFKAFNNSNGKILDLDQQDPTHSIVELPNIQIFNSFGYQNDINDSFNNFLLLPSTKTGVTILMLEKELFSNSTVINRFEEFPGIENKKIKKFHLYRNSLAGREGWAEVPDVTLLTSDGELFVLHFGIEESDWHWRSLGTKIFGQKIFDIQYIKEKMESISPHVRIILDNDETVILRKDYYLSKNAEKIITVIDDIGGSFSIRTIRKEFPDEFPFDSVYTNYSDKKDSNMLK